ncbi:hypothetical protein FRX31_035035, partial [Thalictrum thalictroides]
MSVESWIPPPPGWIKINFVATFHSYRQQGAIAVVASRDHEGRILGAEGLKIRDQDAFEAKFRGAEQALQFALKSSFIDAVIEGDNSTVIKTVKGASEPTMMTRGVSESCRLLMIQFISVICRATKREDNYVAHRLAAEIWDRGSFNVNVLSKDY